MGSRATPLEIEAWNANAGYPGTMTAAEADEALRGILEHGLRHIPGTTPAEERQFNDGYAFGLYRARDLMGRVAALSGAVLSVDRVGVEALDVATNDGARRALAALTGMMEFADKGDSWNGMIDTADQVIGEDGLATLEARVEAARLIESPTEGET